MCKNIDNHSTNKLMIRQINKSISNSDALCEGVCEGLCLLSNETIPKKCSSNIIKIHAGKTISNIFEKCTWKTFVSLRKLLLRIAELSPQIFLHSLEKFSCNKEELLKLFPNEKFSLIEDNYLAYVLWSIERLAWIPDYFIACIRCLGVMESVEHEELNYINTPLNSITLILNAFKTQTYASFGQIRDSIRALKKDSPEICWKVMKSLLPDSSYCFSYSQKPEYIDISHLELSSHSIEPKKFIKRK